MIKEVAQIQIDPSAAAAFETAVAEAAPLFRRAGCTDFSLERSIEYRGRYLLIVGWESVEAHMVDFRSSEAYQTWRILAGPYFLSPPEVEHVDTVKLSHPSL